jgi:membrane protein YqaA with SNARE-associated domain
MEYVTDLYNWTMSLMASPNAPLWLFIIAFIESSVFPIPPDVLLIGMGLANPQMSFLYATICTVGSVMGGMLGYGIGYFGGHPIATKLFRKERVEGAERIYQKYDIWAVAIAGFTPVPYKVFTILTGVMEAKFWRFVVVSALSRGARFFIVAALMFFFGETIKGFLDKYFGWLTIALFAGIIGGFLAVGWWSKKKHGKVTPEAGSGSNSS